MPEIPDLGEIARRNMINAIRTRQHLPLSGELQARLKRDLAKYKEERNQPQEDIDGLLQEAKDEENLDKWASTLNN